LTVCPPNLDATGFNLDRLGIVAIACALSEPAYLPGQASCIRGCRHDRLSQVVRTVMKTVLIRHFYGASAIGLAAWEATAYATRFRVPTVSTVTCRARHRHRRMTLLTVVAWTAGLVVHLARHEVLSDR
jgi:hypothetical protein